MRVRRVRLLICAVVLGAVGFAGAALAAPSPERAKAKLTDYFSPSDIQRSRAYRGPRYALAFAGIAAGLACAAVLGLGRVTRWLGRRSAAATGGRWVLQALLLTAVITIAVSLVETPFGYARFLQDRHWGLATQSSAGFFADSAKGAGFQLGIAAITALGFLGIVRALPRAWPAVAAAFAVVLTVVMIYILPVIYEPLFNKFTPVEPDVRARVLAIAAKAGVKVDDVLVADASRRTTRQNAYVSGLGATKRVVLYDTLLRSSTPQEVDLVVAHELGHVAHRDVLKGTVVASVGAALAVLIIWRLVSWTALRGWLGASGPGDPRLLPFLAFLLAAGSFVTLPLGNWYSRSIEAAADRAAIEYTNDPETAIKVEVNLARSNLSDLEPNGFIRWAFFTHPPTLERIQIALDEARTSG